jgi:hypothetical protein
LNTSTAIREKIRIERGDTFEFAGGNMVGFLRVANAMMARRGTSEQRTDK